MDYDRFICEISKNRECNLLRELSKVSAEGPPNQISFGGGMPNSSTFPFESMHIRARDGFEFNFEGESLASALQYGSSTGLAELRQFILRIQKQYHDPPLLKRDDFEIIVTVGVQDGLSKVFQMLLSPGDNVLLEELVFPGTLAVLKPLPVNLLAVECDDEGVKPDSLLKVLSKWNPEDAKNPTSDIPKVLYVVPNGGNPTGSTATAERKKKIYEIAQLYNLIIIEDDPYYFLQFQKDRVPSYQSMDVDGRVIRGDSMSKVISSGLRIGWISGAKTLIERLFMDQQSNVMHASSLSQFLVLKILEHWQLDGFENHVRSLRFFYQSQRDMMIAGANKWLKGLAEWSVPQSGMFLWVRFFTLTDTKAQLFRKAWEKAVIVVPGEAFIVNKTGPSQYCRLSYSNVTEEQIDQGLKRLADVIHAQSQSKLIRNEEAR